MGFALPEEFKHLQHFFGIDSTNSLERLRETSCSVGISEPSNNITFLTCEKPACIGSNLSFRMSEQPSDKNILYSSWFLYCIILPGSRQENGLFPSNKHILL